MATVKANTTLVIKPAIGASYDLTFGGITQYGRTSGDTIGVFPVDKEYTLVKYGDVEVYAVDQYGTKSYEAADFPASLPDGDGVLVDKFFKVSESSELVSLRNIPSDYYAACIPCNQLAGSGSAKDVTGHYCEVYPSSLTGEGTLTDAQMWANAGYITTTAGTGGGAVIPASQFSYDLSKHVVVFNIRINAAAPGAASAFFGNGAAGGQSTGFFLKAAPDGRVQVWLCVTGGSGPVFSPGTSTLTYFDSTDHDLTFCMHPSGYMAMIRDGVIDRIWNVDGLTRIVGTTAPTYGCAIGAAAGSSQTSIAGKFSNIHLFVFNKLPLNLGAMAKAFTKRPGISLTAKDVIVAKKEVLLYWGAGQSNENGSGNTQGITGDLGVPFKDIGTRSIMPGINALLAKRKIAVLWSPTAYGSTSAAESWCGRVRNWVSGLMINSGSYVIYSGNLYKCTNALAFTASSTAAPAVGTGADTITWAMVGAVTAEDTAVAAGTGVYPSTSSRWDPNGLIAAAVNKSALATGKVDAKIAMISAGQQDRTVGSKATTYSDALQKLATYHAANGADLVLLGMTVRGSDTTNLSSANGGGSANAANTSQDSWYDAELLPGYASALAATSSNPKIKPGWNWATGIGALADSTSPATIGVKSTDHVHMTDATYETKAVPLVDAALRSVGF